MKVLVITGTLYPAQLAVWRAAHADGVHVQVAGTLASSRMNPMPWISSSGTEGRVSVLRKVGPARRGHLWWLYPGVAEIIREQQPDLIHVASEAWGLLVTQALRYGIPVTVHGADNRFDFGREPERTLRLRQLRRNLRRLAGYASWNERGVILAHKYGLRADAPTVVAPAVLPDPSPFLSIPLITVERLPMRLLFLGRLDYQKGVDVLLRAVQHVPWPTVTTVVGRGPEEPTLRAMARRLGLNVRFQPFVPQEHVPALYAEADVTVVPSRDTALLSEQFGRVAVESMLAARPAIVSNSGELPRVVNDGRFVFAQDDAEGLAGALTSLKTAGLTTASAAVRQSALSTHTPTLAARALREFWRSAGDPTLALA